MKDNAEEFYDMVIIGGGSTGSGIALDASTRGYKVLLLDKDDFASGTSSKSSKLIHGGVRYLEKAIKQFDKSQYNLVKEALSERNLFLKNAPHLAKTLKLDTPIYKWLDIAYVYIGLLIYRLISGSKKIKDNEYINKTVLSLTQPNIKKENLKGAISFYDGRFIDSRMVIALLQTAQYYGLEARNYNEVKSFLYDKENKISGLEIYNKLEDKRYTVKSNCIINASGANVDNIRKIDDNNCEEVMQLSSGIHIVIDKKVLPYYEGILIPKTSDGRVIFVLPYLEHCLIGTTDNKVDYTTSREASKEDIDYLINHVNEYFDIKIEDKDILSSWSGIRPLIKEDKKHTQELVRE
ncbi:glycerol-3-phosphate dehydrogenase/oxidase, partial [Poseidonibacter sp.]|uniref:glycerol-3-phosphate dehydrogenase/oxidase n=1 Tax=Poseidonibacter sp. TaxID=2321188 RepID=UPI003C7718C6